MNRKGGWGDLLPKELGYAVYRRAFLNPGTMLVLAIAALTLVLWLLQSPASLGDPFKILAKVSAFSALTFLSLNFLLSTRARWLERLFGGLDRMYGAHCTVGRMSLLWMVLHPLALLAANLGDMERLFAIFLPGVDPSNTLGTASLLLFLLLMALTVVYALPYGSWLSGHRLMLAVLLLAAYHALASGSDIAAHPALAVWTAGITAIGVASSLYTMVLYRYLGPRSEMRVAGIQGRQGATDVRLEHDGAFKFRPGQFIYALFDGTDDEFHPFSISGHGDGWIRISVKASGNMTSGFSRDVREDTNVVVRGPYGNFGGRGTSDRPEVWLAGGIGITPFLGLLQAERENPTGRSILLVWSYRVHGELPYEGEIMGYLADIPGLAFVHWNSTQQGRVSAKALGGLLEGDLIGNTFRLCGPRAMMRDLGRQLVSAGVHARDVVQEDFDLV